MNASLFIIIIVVIAYCWCVCVPSVCLELLGQKVGVLLEWKRKERILLPELGTEVSVGRSQGVVNGLDEVSHGSGVSGRAGVAVGDTGHAHELLSGGRRNQSGTARGGNETDRNGTALSGDLAGHGVGKAGGTSPVSSSDGNNVELGGGDGTANGGGNLGGALDSETDVSVGITNCHKGLEASALTGRGLLLDRHDLHDLVLELVLEEIVDDLGFLDGDGKQKDLLDGGNLSLLDQTSELGYGDPDVLVASSSSAAATASATASSSASTASSASESSASSFWCWGLLVAHGVLIACWLACWLAGFLWIAFSDKK
mmetsp:Transcript_14999/g.41739  ORF Transcript_14999/g.41739 Transcript_14999/m.41739 type:complete len:314 (-) Transcript_14999:40-981(-)